MTKPIYSRILLKLSGEALKGNKQFGIDLKTVDRLATEITNVSSAGVQVGIVIGGGNIFRGGELEINGLDRVTADRMGMLATVMNAMVMQDAFLRAGHKVQVLSAVPVEGMVDTYDKNQATEYLNDQKRIIIFAGGTGSPYVTTDSAASLRAIETKADVLIKATNVDGVYDSDPRKNPAAKLYKRLSYTEALEQKLAVMDLGAFSDCRDHKVKINVFNLSKPDALLNIVMGEQEGTLVEGD